jgi:hypothetical protein
VEDQLAFLRKENEQLKARTKVSIDLHSPIS